MKDRHSITSQLDLARRDLLKGTAATGVLALAGAFGLSRPANAAASSTVSAYGVTTAQLKDWSLLEKSTGLKMQYVGSNNDVGVFMRDVMASQMGNKVDLFIFEGGTQDILGPQGAYQVIDQKHPALKLWDRTADTWKHSATVMGKNGKQYGVPVIGNADSFGYFPDKIGVSADGEADVSWKMMFEDERTRGRVGYDKTWNYSIGVAGMYLNATGKAKVANPADPTPAEAKVIVDFLVARKKAGQFRTLVSSFEEQIQLLTNHEVDILNCWEPAVREANAKLGAGKTRYAYTVEGYYKWGHGAYIASQAKSRGNMDNIYKMLNYFLDGEYRAYQARDRGYAGPNMDLGVEYATSHNWCAQQVQELKDTQKKVDRKFAKPFVSTTTPTHSDAIEDEWQRFLNA
ncbi:ABC transporter substrate-binding protein [Robbsia andropogonis]|uniref:ABC transporter substrate-binding protein n=1 Tax=Robbsia andropogonis TaxID=28092 RepID=UPI0020A083C4|nr:PotD/PotF family extracellular solute-binding protein [Robbsia andropogonis]MCP1119419.1 PotD/PotF family extracellular solute-binding protein [Robbsia andropogonis]MCP1129402.1 PotD/PotF family extracellular solute-binding protein [Robbsia andropogonis]